MGLEHLNAKYKYIQLCQGLPTFGVTLFVVKVSCLILYPSFHIQLSLIYNLLLSLS